MWFGVFIPVQMTSDRKSTYSLLALILDRCDETEGRIQELGVVRLFGSDFEESQEFVRISSISQRRQVPKASATEFALYF